MRKKQDKDNRKLFNFDRETKEGKRFKEKKKEKKAEKKSALKKEKKNKNKAKENIGQANTKKRYDDEIIIGVTRYPDKKEPTKKKIKEDKKKRRNTKKKIEKYKVEKKNNKRQKNTTKNKKSNIIIKITIWTVLAIGVIACASLSPLFNIRDIEVLGNEHVSKEEILSLSEIMADENIFKVQNRKVSKNIKQNAYINDVQIHKLLPNKMEIKVTEREPSYMLEYGNGYVYINNQGYMLEISSIKKDLPILLGITTLKEDYKDGNRLNEEDLSKLGTVIKVMDAAQTSGIAKLITKVDFSDVNNYILHFETERKVVYLGDCSNLETRMLFLVGILEKEKENPGEIFVNMNLNTDNAYFRESV